MSDADLEAKFRGLCEPILSRDCIDALIEQCWSIDTMEAMAPLAHMSVPQDAEAEIDGMPAAELG